MLNLSAYLIRNSRSLIACLLLFGLGEGMVESSTLLHPTDHVVFIGDSITGQGSKPGGWVGIMQAALDSTYVGPRPTLVGLGGSGSGINAWVGYEKTSRTQRLTLDSPDVDVRSTLDGKVDVIVVMLGVNDILSPHIKDTPADLTAWHDQYRDFIHALRARSHPRLIALATPTMGTENPDSFRNKVIDEMIEQIKRLGVSENCVIIPTNETFWSYLNEGRTYYPDYHLTRDGIHPNEAGHALFAATMLKGLGEDAASAKVLQQNAQVILKRVPDTLSYRLRRLPGNDPTEHDTFELLSFNKTDAPAVTLTLPDGWKILSQEQNNGLGKFRINGVPDKAINKITLKAGEKEVGIGIPPAWKLGTVNMDYLGWVGSTFDPVKGKLPGDDALAQGNGFDKPFEIAPGHTITWTRYIATPDDSDQYLAGAFNMGSDTFFQDYDIGYGARWIYSDHDRPAALDINNLGFAGYNYLSVWLNGTQLFLGEAVRGKLTTVPCHLRKGWNCLSFKSNHLQWLWMLQVDLHGLAGDDCSDLRFSAEPHS